VRIQHVEQRVGDLRQLVVELLADPRRQEGEALQQPLDVGILALVGLQMEPGGDLGILAANSERRRGCRRARRRRSPAGRRHA
jgi:hypothetical protein